MAQLNGENFVIANWSKPGSSGDGGRLVGLVGGELEFAPPVRLISGPPQTDVILVRTENARREVVRSSGERAKWLTASMNDSKIDWLSI